MHVVRALIGIHNFEVHQVTCARRDSQLRRRAGPLHEKTRLDRAGVLIPDNLEQAGTLFGSAEEIARAVVADRQRDRCEAAAVER